MPTTDFGEWARAARDSRGLTQDGLAKLAVAEDKHCKLYQSRVTDWERGLWVPNLRQFLAVVKALKLTESEAAIGRQKWEDAQLHDEPSVVPAEPSVTT